MNVFYPPDRHALLAGAESAVRASGMRVLDRRRESGEHQLDLIAAVPASTLVGRCRRLRSRRHLRTDHPAPRGGGLNAR